MYVAAPKFLPVSLFTVATGLLALSACGDASDPIIPESVSETRQAVSAGRVVAYVDGTTGAINAGALDGTKYTHINYAFANLDANGNVYFTYGAQDENNINAIKGLKSQNPNLKILVSVGGWTWSNHFSTVAGDATKRANMVSSIWNLVNTRGLDGIDIDWEWPGWQGEGDNAVCGGTCDGQRLVTLMQQIWNSRPAGKLVTMAGGAHPNMGAYVDLGALANYVDFLNIMTYDFHGPWESAWAHHANVYGGDISIDSAVNMYLNEGFPRTRLVVGIPFYGKAWGMSDPSPLYKNISCSGTNDGASCTVNGISGHILHYNTAMQAAYMEGGGRYISFDNLVSVGWKTSYINSKSGGLGGAMYWQALQDKSNRELTNKIWADVGGSGGGGGGGGCSTVQVFADHYFGGASYCIPVGDHPNITTLGVPNDWVTSIKVAAGYTATLYEHGSFGGAALTRTADDASLVDDGWNDRLSSIKVQPAFSGNYRLVAQCSGMCLDVAGSGVTDGTNIQQWTCNGTAAQSFRIESVSGGYRLVNNNSNKCVDVNAAGVTDGTNIQQWWCNGSAAQTFSITAVGGGYYRLTNTNSGKCMDVNNASTSAGANVQIWNCNGSTAQSWLIQGI